MLLMELAAFVWLPSGGEDGEGFVCVCVLAL
jgi:hypothetical protein